MCHSPAADLDIGTLWCSVRFTVCVAGREARFKRGYGGPNTASELDWIWVVVDVDVGEHPNHLLNHRGVRHAL